ncbi:membrane protein required for colicin V production [Balneicella halophila]|uniref:Membrane protein required for colicin V production n=1 Tax=Balneicella halophila TaxID=1537566 RepID=A0A7L4URY8_BALHA|nr:CvpA family protein [Balneicella halophila]PVX52520.1 membrane protein required for colicin V production [Balneicella halophila]
MVWIDIVLLIIILWFAYKGFRNGFIVELTTFAALILAIWGALKYRLFTTEFLHDKLGMQGDYLPFLSFVITFLVILVAVSIIGKVITQALHIAQLGILNRLLGLIFGLLKIGIILSLVVNGLDRVNKDKQIVKQKTINDSYLYYPLNGFAGVIYEFADEHFDEVKETIDKTLEDIDSTPI